MKEEYREEGGGDALLRRVACGAVVCYVSEQHQRIEREQEMLTSFPSADTY